MIRDGAKGAECRGCCGQKRVKLTATCVKWKNQGHRRLCHQPTSLQVEACCWKLALASAHGGGRRREDRRVEARRSLVDVGVPPGR